MPWGQKLLSAENVIFSGFALRYIVFISIPQVGYWKAVESM
jgi:hypothetical protein